MRGDRTSAVVIACLALGLIIALAWLQADGDTITVLWLIREDGLYESLGALASLAAGVTFLFLALRRADGIPPQAEKTPWRWWYAALGIGLVLMFVEEISWGQRVLGFSTPEWLERENRQQEFNLHNLFLFNPDYDFNWLKLLWSAGSTVYLGLMALASAMSSRIRGFFDRWGIPIAHWTIGVTILLAFAWYLYGTDKAVTWGNHFAGHAVGETFEVVIELLYFGLALQCAITQLPIRKTWLLSLAVTVLPAAAMLATTYYRNGPLGPDVMAAAELQQGITLYSMGEHAAALPHFERSVELVPSNPRAEFHLGVIHHSLNHPDAAIQHFRAALNLDPGMVDARFNLGLVLFANQQFSLAAEAFEQVVADRPEDAEAHYYLGSSFRQLGKLQEAANQLEEAIRIRPGFEAAMKELRSLQAKPSVEPGP